MDKQPRYNLALTHKQLAEDVLARINRIYSENAVQMWGEQV